MLGRPAYKPALGVATRIPGVKWGQTAPVQPRPLTKETLKSFVMIEAPSESVDSVYADILATLNQRKNEDDIQAIRTIMAEGEDHYRRFLAIQEWLSPYDDSRYLRRVNMAPPPSNDKSHVALQKLYAGLLNLLYEGYLMGMPDGAQKLNSARNKMIGQDGIESAAEAVAKKGFIVVFDTPDDPRFSSVKPPP
jgi:hypothetical protein